MIKETMETLCWRHNCRTFYCNTRTVLFLCLAFCCTLIFTQLHSGYIQTEGLSASRSILKLVSDKRNEEQCHRYIMSCEETQFKKRLPDVLIIGEQKCGTSTIRQFLSLTNTKVRIATKELKFFNSKHIRGRSNLTSADLQEYLERMPESCPSDIVLEKTPEYFIKRGAEEAIYNWKRGVKLLLSLRDPIDRAVSSYHMKIRKGVSPDAPYYQNHTFEELTLTKNGSVNTSFESVMRSIYTYNMQRWLKLFPLEQIHIIDGDNFNADPSTELMKVERYLGLEPECTPDKFVFVKSKGYFCVKGCNCKEDGSGPGHIHAPINETIWKTLRDFYAPHVRILQRITGRTLSWMPKYLSIQ